MSLTLSTGRLPQVIQSPENAAFKDPLRLQFIEAQRVGHSAERFQGVISDGVYSIPVLLTGPASASLLQSNPQEPSLAGVVLEATEYKLSCIDTRRTFIILACRVLGREPLIGNPQTLEMNGHDAGAQRRGVPTRYFPPSEPSMGGPPRPRLAAETQGDYSPPQLRGPGQGAMPDSFARAFQPQSVTTRPAIRPPVQSQPGGGYATRVAPLPPQQPRQVSAEERLTPLNQLDMYCTRWTIMARCTAKSKMRTYNNARGEGKLFSFDLLDGEDGQIRCTAFNEAAVMFYESVQIGRIYRISKADVSEIRNLKFKTFDTNFEIRLNMSSSVEYVPEEAAVYSIPYVLYRFKPIESVQEMATGSQIDVVGIVTHVQSVRRITKKNGDEVDVRNVTIKDSSNCSIEVTMWDDLAAKEGQEIEDAWKTGGIQIVAFSRMRVGDYNHKSLSTQGVSRVELNPDHPDAHALANWGQQAGDGPVTALSKEGAMRFTERSTLGDISVNTVDPEKHTFFTVCCTITWVQQERMFYPACPLQRNGRSCLKKLLEHSPTEWSCETCGESMPEPEWRYIFDMRLRDHTEMHYATAFGSAEQIVGMPAKDLKEMDSDTQCSILSHVMHTPRLFLLKAMISEYLREQDKFPVRLAVIRQQPIDFAEETKVLLKDIEQYKELPGLTSVEQEEEETAPSRMPYMPYAVPQTPVHQKFGNHGFPS